MLKQMSEWKKTEFSKIESDFNKQILNNLNKIQYEPATK